MAERKALLALLALAAAGGCEVRREGETAEPPEPGQAVACALEGEQQFTRTCSFERSDAGASRILVIHHPDGSFRRFEQVTDGRGLIAADGADAVTIAPAEEMVEVAIAGDRYLLPATFRSDAPGE